NDDQNAVRRILHHLGDYGFHDVVVGVEQVVAAHPGFARNARGHHYDVGIGSVFIVIGPADVRISLFDRHGLEEVKALALWHAVDDVDQDDIGELFRGDPMSSRRAHVSRTYNADFLAHDKAFSGHGSSRISTDNSRNSSV